MKVTVSNIYSGDDRTLTLGKLTCPWPFPIASMLHSSCAMVFGRCCYTGEKRPVVNTIRKFLERLIDVKYWFLYRLVKDYQYHVIYTDLKPSYHCSDSRILYGVMKCLQDYVEADKHGGEKGLEEHVEHMRTKPDTNAPEGLEESCANMDAEALAIYRWWKYEKPVDEKRERELLLQGYTNRKEFMNVPEAERALLRDEHRLLKKKIEEDEQSYLHRLINIRQGLWI